MHPHVCAVKTHFHPELLLPASAGALITEAFAHSAETQQQHAFLNQQTNRWDKALAASRLLSGITFMGQIPAHLNSYREKLQRLAEDVAQHPQRDLIIAQFNFSVLVRYWHCEGERIGATEALYEARNLAEMLSS